MYEYQKTIGLTSETWNFGVLTIDLGDFKDILQINSVKPPMIIVGSLRFYKRGMINLRIDYILWQNPNRHKKNKISKLNLLK